MRTASPTRRRYRREAALVAAVLLPWAALLPMGFLWLWRTSWAAWWLVGAAASLAAAFALRRSLLADARLEAEAAAARISPASAEWGAREAEAWRLVERIGAETEPLSFADIEPVIALARRIFDAVAEHFYPGAARARFRVTLPEGLLLLERLSHDLRAALLTHVPGSAEIRVSDALLLKELYDRFGGSAKRPDAGGVERLAEAAGRLAGAALAEAAGPLAGQLGRLLSRRIRAELTMAMVREAGRAAIDLYSGRLRLADEELRRAGLAESESARKDLVGPIRILLAGQVNAGKSSLLNAMAGQVQRTVGVTPTREGDGELRLELAGRPEAILVDAPGIGIGPDAMTALTKLARTADLILWVASATQPAREADVAALQELGAAASKAPDWRMPPVLCVVTHIDELTPAREWAPPYDIGRPDRPKAFRIRDAVEHIGATLGVDRDLIVPVCVRDADAAYNIDLLWSLLAANLDAARLVKLDRLYKGAGGFSRTRVLRQMAAGGRWLARSVWRGGA